MSASLETINRLEIAGCEEALLPGKARLAQGFLQAASSVYDELSLALGDHSENHYCLPGTHRATISRSPDGSLAINSTRALDGFMQIRLSKAGLVDEIVTGSSFDGLGERHGSIEFEAQLLLSTLNKSTLLKISKNDAVALHLLCDTPTGTSTLEGHWGSWYVESAANAVKVKYSSGISTAEVQISPNGRFLGGSVKELQFPSGEWVSRSMSESEGKRHLELLHDDVRQHQEECRFAMETAKAA